MSKTMKLCVDCMYHARDAGDHKCLFRIAINPVDGTKSAKSCLYLRADIYSCGPEGKWFAPKTEDQPNG